MWHRGTDLRGAVESALLWSIEAFLDKEAERYWGQQIPDNMVEHHVGKYMKALHALVMERIEQEEM